MDYIEISFHNSPEQNELLIAFLSQDFDSFEEADEGIHAYIPADRYSEEKLRELLERLKETGTISYSQKLIADRNWNALWESNFEPVLIGEQVFVRAPFHESKTGVKHELVIKPKMTFGTGHHSTTSLMIEEMLRINFPGCAVLDMGCGSGILAILADKLGAKNIVAIDVEEWAYQNSLENCRRNQSQHIVVQKGDASLIQGMAFDVILANINRNVLLQDMPAFNVALRKNGQLLMSGFMVDDLKIMMEAGKKLGLHVHLYHEKSIWAMIHFEKS